MQSTLTEKGTLLSGTSVDCETVKAALPALDPNNQPSAQGVRCAMEASVLSFCHVLIPGFVQRLIGPGPPEPLAAAVTRPLASTVRLALV